MRPRYARDTPDQACVMDETRGIIAAAKADARAAADAVRAHTDELIARRALPPS